MTALSPLFIKCRHCITCCSPVQGPYYERHFRLIVETVHHAAHNHHLFLDSERAVLDSVLSLSTECLLLFIRIFQRSAQWIRTAKLEYPEISAGLIL
jgi:hypothetical protein